MPIVPDTKDWTWILERPCPDCGFDAGAYPREGFGRVVRELAGAWRVELARAGVRLRPAPDRWSALEYGCHVRDVFRLFDARVELMLNEEGPVFANFDQDAAAIALDYGGQDPAAVADGLERAAEALANRFDSMGPEGWSRTGTRSNGSRFEIESLGRYLIHDPVHHLSDVAEGARRPSGQ